MNGLLLRAAQSTLPVSVRRKNHQSLGHDDIFESRLIFGFIYRHITNGPSHASSATRASFTLWWSLKYFSWREKWPNRCCDVEIFSLATTHASSKDEDRRSEKSLLFEQAKWTFNKSSIEKMRAMCRRAAATTAWSKNSWVSKMYIHDDNYVRCCSLVDLDAEKTTNFSLHTAISSKKKRKKSTITSSGKIMYSLNA